MCVNRNKTMYQCIHRFTWIQKIYTFTYMYTSNVSVSIELLAKRYFYRGQSDRQTSKIYPIWMKMVSYYLSCNALSKKELKTWQHQMLLYHSDKTKYIKNSMGLNSLICFVLLHHDNKASDVELFFFERVLQGK